MQYINYRENRRRGTADFPLEYYHVTASHPQYVMSFHWHVEFELIRILSGSLTVTIDEIEFLAEAGDSIFIPAGSIHSGIPDDCVYECLVFDMNMLMNKTDPAVVFFARSQIMRFPFSRTIRKSAITIHRTLWTLLMSAPPKRWG